MNIRYTVVDQDNSPIQFTADDMIGYELKNVTPFKCAQFNNKDVAYSELKGIERILRNDDYYNVYVANTVKLPLKVAKVKSYIEIIEE